VLVLNDRSVERLDATVGDLRSRGASVLDVPGDVTDRTVIQNVVARAVSEFGRLDIMHNNAGGMSPFRFHELPEDKYRRLMALNLDAYVFGCQAAIAVMLGQPNGGVVLNTASVMGVLGDSLTAAYSAAKAGVLNLTRALAVEYADAGIRVNAVIPGSIATGGNERAFAMLPDGTKERMEAQLPMRRQGTPLEVANVALLLVSDEASYVTGATVPVDGGQTAKLASPKLTLD
jgi:NAD(P)-dependent dehydrogenase (short-subunit alcohol dehydrogenase family)